MKLPNVSIVIISKNRHELLQRAVESLLNIDYPTDKYEIIILEETNIPMPISGVNILYNTIPCKNKGFGYARNRAIEKCSYDYICFFDDDCIAEPNWLEELIKPFFSDSSIVAVSGGILIPENSGLIGKCESILGFPGGGLKYIHMSKTKKIRTFSTCNVCIKRQALDRVGGFNEKLRFGGEDEILAYNIIKTGGCIYYQPKAIVRHLPRDSIIKIVKWFVRRGKAKIDVMKYSNIDGSIKSLLIQSPVLRLSVLTIISLNSYIPFYLLFFPVVILYYIYVLYKYRWGYLYFKDYKVILLTPIIRFVMDLSFDLGLIMALVLRD